jgi:hypothetical protein
VTFRGYIKNGKVVVNDPIDLPDGTKVNVAPDAPDRRRPANRGASKRPRRRSGETLYDRYQHLIGKARGLPRDFAAQHDHYMHGAPRR